jgi:outer membrane protein assembly factor BamB
MNYLSRILGLTISFMALTSCSKSNDDEQTETNEVQSVFVKHYQSNPPNGDLSYSFKCLNGNLSVKWEKTAKEFFPTTQLYYGDGKIFYSSISINPNGVYPNNIFRHLNAIDPNTGALVWSKRTVGEVYSPLCYKDNVLYCSYGTLPGAYNNDKSISAFDAITGNRLWSKILPDFYYPAMAIADGASVYMIAQQDGSYPGRLSRKLISINLQTKMINWEYVLQQGDDASFFTSALLMNDNKIYTDTWIGENFCFDKNSGLKVWQHTTPAFRFGASNGNIYLTPILYRNQIYLNDRFLQKAYKLDPATGNLTGTWSMPRFLIDCEPSIYNNKIYAFGQNYPGGIIYAFRCADGSEVLRKEIPDQYAYPIIAGNKIYATLYQTASRTSLPKLMSFDASSGMPIDSITVGSVSSSSLYKNDYQVLTNDGQLLIGH